jgi:hypothetical protein
MHDGTFRLLYFCLFIYGLHDLLPFFNEQDCLTIDHAVSATKWGARPVELGIPVPKLIPGIVKAGI